MISPSFDMQAGALCLDFANTVDWHASQHPSDQLEGYVDLARWGEAAGILSALQVERLCQTAERQPLKAAEAFNNAIKIREVIFRIFSSLADQGIANPDDLDILNLALSRSWSHLQIIQSSPGFIWDWKEDTDSLEQVVWAVARSAGELLTSEKLHRARMCADDRGCGYLFIDTSRNGSRRWCSMESCGNRAKARRHYTKQFGAAPQ